MRHVLVALAVLLFLAAAPATSARSTGPARATASADLQLQLSPPSAPVYADRTVYANAQMSNYGPDHTEDDTITFTLSPGLSYAGKKVNQLYETSCTTAASPSGQVVTCQFVFSFSPSSLEVDMPVRAAVAGDYTISAAVVSPTPDPEPSNNSSAVTFHVEAAPPYSLRAGKINLSPRRPRVGKRLKATMRVTRSDTGEVVKTGAVTCAASVAGRKLTPSVDGFARSAAACAWLVPRSVRGKTIKGSVTVTSKGHVAKRSFSGKTAAR
jgi:hypothetical protein